MLDFESCTIEKLIVHQVGNKQEDEGVVVSDEVFEVDEELNFLLKTYFFKAFGNVNTYYRFVDEEDLSKNRMYGITQQIFENDAFVEGSQHILDHLYDQSDHPHIKRGDLLIAKFNNVIADDEVVEAIGIFKVERKDSFLKIWESSDDGMWIDVVRGVNINKMDKGVFIFNTNAANGYKLSTVDSNNYDAVYWMDDFLGIDVNEDKNYFTKNTLEVIKGFAEDIVKPNNDTREQVNLLNQSFHYFEEEENFDMDRFAKDVIKEPAYIEEFKNYAQVMEEEKGIKVNESFDIAPVAVKAAKKGVKSVINLDTNIQIKLDFSNPDSAYQFMERGYDQEKGMYFYKVYFNRETK